MRLVIARSEATWQSVIPLHRTSHNAPVGGGAPNAPHAPRPQKTCHCEPVRTPVWQSAPNFPLSTQNPPTSAFSRKKSPMECKF